MVGVIRKWEILTHPVVTIQCFGLTVFLRALFAGQGKTFLSLVTEAGAFGRPTAPATQFIERCAALERRAMRIYETLSERFRDLDSASEFFRILSRQEASHAELLELCRAAAGRGRWQSQCFDPLRETVPKTECRLDEAEEALNRHESLADALRLVLRIESSQINDLFTGVVKATDSRLLTKFDLFRNAVRAHLCYIREQIPILLPELKRECEDVLGRCSPPDAGR